MQLRDDNSIYRACRGPGKKNLVDFCTWKLLEKLFPAPPFKKRKQFDGGHEQIEQQQYHEQNGNETEY